MKTLVLKVDPSNPENGIVEQAGAAIRRGELVAFPTETVYGLGADAFNMEAVARIYEVKGRPENNPLPVQVARKEDIQKVAFEIPEIALRLVDKYFPGPLTLVLRASPNLPYLVTAGTGKVGIRIPNHPVAQKLIKASGTPIVAPSANISGEPPPTSADEVLAYLDGRINILLDAGHTILKESSTVIDMTKTPPKIIREGSIRAKELADIFKEYSI